MADMTAEEREFYGQIVRLVWIEWAKEQPNPKPSWLVPWGDLPEPDKEVDRRIGARIVEVSKPRWHDAITEAVAAERAKLNREHAKEKQQYRNLAADAVLAARSAGVAAEREACAELARNGGFIDPPLAREGDLVDRIAEAIEARSTDQEGGGDGACQE